MQIQWRRVFHTKLDQGNVFSWTCKLVHFSIPAQITSLPSSDLLKWKQAGCPHDWPLLILLMGQPQPQGFQKIHHGVIVGRKSPPTKIRGLCQQEENSSWNCQMNVLTNKIRPPLRPEGARKMGVVSCHSHPDQITHWLVFSPWIHLHLLNILWGVLSE